MGYNLTIGEAYIESDPETGFIEVAAKRHWFPMAPDADHNGSSRSPSYSSWANCMAQLGLTELMYGCKWVDATGQTCESSDISADSDVRCLMGTHCGATRITETHVLLAEAALITYKLKHPTHRPSYNVLKPGVAKDPIFNRPEDYIDDPANDGALLRGEWLAFWLRLAYENCDCPVWCSDMDR